jgi:hypothetical protein
VSNLIKYVVWSCIVLELVFLQEWRLQRIFSAFFILIFVRKVSLPKVTLISLLRLRNRTKKLIVVLIKGVLNIRAARVEIRHPIAILQGRITLLAYLITIHSDWESPLHKLA